MNNKLYYAFFKNRLKKPVSIIVFVTDRCNSRCRHCFNWKNLNTNAPEISLKDINKFSNGLNNLMDVAISGGEPYLREDLDKICRIFIENNSPRFFTIPTNGQLPEKISNKTEEIISKNSRVFFSLNLALDGTEKTHDYIRGVPGSYERLKKTYTLLSCLKEKYKNLSVKIDTTLCNKNIEELSDLITLVKEEFPLADFHNFEIMRGEPLDKNLAPPSMDKIRDSLPLIYSTWEGSHFYGRNSRFKSFLARGIKMFIFKMYIDILKNKKQIIPCFADKFSCVLWANGDIAFCELLPPIGNIKENDFDSIWQGEKALDQHKLIREKRCFCVHSCFQNKNIMFNPGLYPSIIKSFFINAHRTHNP